MGLFLRGGIWRLLMLVPLALVTIHQSLSLVDIIKLESTTSDIGWDPETRETKLALDPTRNVPSKEKKANVLRDYTTTVKFFNTSTKADLTNKTSILLPPVMDLWRRGISIHSVYGVPLPRKGGEGEGECSCRNPRAQKECCMRTIRFGHKMGTALVSGVFRGYQPDELFTVGGIPPPPLKYLYQEGGEDYRFLLMFRNIYDALKSGYLYHRMGRECWLDPYGRPVENWNGTEERVHANWYRWKNVLALKVPHRNRSLCEFLQQEDEKLGMQAYIDFVFNAYYVGLLTHWTLARAFPEEVGERSKHACYEDFVSPTKDKQTIESAASFLFNQTIEWHGNLTGQTVYAGIHAASHHADPDQSRRLLQIMRELDEEVFNNELAWIDSVLPC